MTDRAPVEPVTFQQLPPKLFEEVNRQFRATRNDILRFGVWSLRNLSDEEFNHTDDHRLLGYFRTDLLETRFLSKGRRIDIVQLWNWFDDLVRGTLPLVLEGGEEVFLNIADKDLEKLRKRMEEISSFMPILRTDDLEQFKRVKFKLRRTVLRMTYDLHHLTKRMDKQRKSYGGLRRPLGPMPAPPPEVEMQRDLHEESNETEPTPV
jgi:hypothetical protein